MILTEDEANTKRCQESFPAGDRMFADGPTLKNEIPEELRKHYPEGVTHTVSTYAPVHCIGSACMAWRWHWAVHDDGTHHHVNTPNGAPLGYCGKAGKP